MERSYPIIAILLLASAPLLHAQVPGPKAPGEAEVRPVLRERLGLDLEDIWTKGLYNAKGVRGIRSMKDGAHYTTLSKGDDGVYRILKWSYQSGEVTDTLLQGSQLAAWDPNPPQKVETQTDAAGNVVEFQVLPTTGPELDGYELSPDQSHALVWFGRESIYRHSFKARYLMVELASGAAWAVGRIDKGKEAPPLIQVPQLSPVGLKVAYVQDNNLYIHDLKAGKRLTVTRDGAPNRIINGTTDWVYEEEFGFADGHKWSPTGDQLAYYRFDESHVRQFRIPIYKGDYPEDMVYKYPRAGEENARVDIRVYDLKSGKTLSNLVKKGAEDYVPRLYWIAGKRELLAMVMNRHQNRLEFRAIDPVKGTERLLYLEEDTTAWVEVPETMHFLKDGSGLIFSSEKSGFHQLWFMNYAQSELRLLTPGPFEVTDFYGVDESTGHFYFQSRESGPLEKKVYKGHLRLRERTCLTPTAGSNSASFSADYSYFINTFSSTGQPPLYTLHRADGSKVRVLEDNAALMDRCNRLDMGTVEFTVIPGADGTSMNAWILKPQDFDPNKKYPILFYVYGGPGSQQVHNSWMGSGRMWYEMLLRQGFIVACVDNRGTGGMGAYFKKTVYRELGVKETQDQIAAAEWFASQSWVDGERMGIWGWSYGGFMSTSCLARGPYKLAIAVAPVTHWKFYDTIYTERYMRTPAENGAGYDKGSPLTFAEGLRGKKYLLVHGTADDNVHFQNAAEMVAELVRLNIPFESAYYPNLDHGIRGGKAREHLYEHMTRFILQNL